MPIVVTINGERQELEEGTTVAHVLEARKIRPEVVSVELNNTILERNQYPATVLQDGDALEFLFFMGGGCP